MEKVKKSKIFSIGFMIFLLTLTAIVSTVWAWDIEQWKRGELSTIEQWKKEKAIFDDPRPIYKTTSNPKNYLPPQAYNKVTFDVEAMKRAWADLVGFKSPDETGKIAPEIKPGTYIGYGKFFIQNDIIHAPSPHLHTFPE